MDAAGFATAHIVGNSLGGYVALQLAARGRARSVVALAPAGGWARDDESYRETLEYFVTHARGDAGGRAATPSEIVATPEGRRQATLSFATNFEHIPAELLAHDDAGRGRLRRSACAMIEYALREGYGLDAAAITCPVRIVWGTADALLPWPSAAERYRREWLPHADWVELDGIGHCPQLDVPLETAQLILGFTAEEP